MNSPALDLRIGTMVKADTDDLEGYIHSLIDHGFESIQPFFSPTLAGIDLPRLADTLHEAIGTSGMRVSALGLYGNPLEAGEDSRQSLAGLEALIDHAHLFGTDTIAAFTGRIRNQPIEASLPRFREIWGELARRAADKSVRIAFENCPMHGSWQRGDWNIAHNPAAWELMFNELPDDNLGLEWEPAHQRYYLIDPVAQLRQWTPRIFHVHGKDAQVNWDVIRSHGIHGRETFAFHRFPGLGDSDWRRIIEALWLNGYRGTIDIEGWHDPVYCDELEMTGQVEALRHLKRCRGSYTPNPF
ncbi:sugar phosphate isomerase/epimerase family protein [Phytohalomonas tamaricis]|uniref:sugar phosphate isomerase/epimerase family protein n=1 Tax=Phytohalomonas tamaricis TaxID=2081032 RepID=UPI000D0BCCE8|nr:sugar phosphate isomerase/epimerase family protein [Phytohalomonas tamaricis]